jgi:hypothetical protein
MNRKRMYNMIYRTRKKGVRISTPQRTVYLPSGFGPDEIKQVGILRREFGFGIQTDWLAL